MSEAAIENEWEYWQSGLAGKPSKATANMVGDEAMSNPQTGFYRRRKHREGPWYPVAFWKKDGEFLAKDPSGMIDPDKHWSWCMGNPITEEDYRHYEKFGKWQGEATVGDNNPPDEDKAIEEQIQDVMASAEVWLKNRVIKTEQESDKAAGFQQKLKELSNKAEKKREEEKKPHWDAGKAVDAKYKPIVKLSDDTITKIKAALTTYLVAKQEKADALAEAERIEAAKKIAAAEKIKADEGKKNLTEKEEEIIAEAKVAMKAPAPVKKVSAGGNTGRKIVLHTVTSGKITDFNKALMALKDHPEMIEFVQKLCNRAAKAGKELDGVEIVEEKVV